MTAQQIEYWKLKESERANKANEAENERYHKQNEYLNSQVNAENARHNRAIESINRANMEVNARNAAINALNAATNARLASLQERRDQETIRHNQMLESIDRDYNDARIALENRKVDTTVDIASEDRSSAERRSYTQSGLSFLGGLGLGKVVNSGKAVALAGASSAGSTSATGLFSVAAPLIGAAGWYAMHNYMQSENLPEYGSTITNAVTIVGNEVGKFINRQKGQPSNYQPNQNNILGGE